MVDCQGAVGPGAYSAHAILGLDHPVKIELGDLKDTVSVAAAVPCAAKVGTKACRHFDFRFLLVGRTLSCDPLWESCAIASLSGCL